MLKLLITHTLRGAKEKARAPAEEKQILRQRKDGPLSPSQRQIVNKALGEMK